MDAVGLSSFNDLGTTREYNIHFLSSRPNTEVFDFSLKQNSVIYPKYTCTFTTIELHPHRNPTMPSDWLKTYETCPYCLVQVMGNHTVLVFVSSKLLNERKAIYQAFGHSFFFLKVKLTYSMSGPSGRSLSQFRQHEVTRDISTTPPWIGCQSPTIKCAVAHLYTWVEREIL